MTTLIDEGKGLVKVFWTDVRERVAIAEPRFSTIVDELAPNKEFPLYLAYRPYGAIVGDTQDFFLPDNKGEYIKLSDPNISRDVTKHLGYGEDSSPMGMVLSKNIEIFIDLKNENIATPWAICPPGSFIAFAKHLSRKNNRVYMPNSVMTATSGIRSTFLLPNIGCNINHSKLKRDFNIQTTPPKSLKNHWHLFKDIINSKVVNCDWQSCVMYFSQIWIDKILNDKSWINVKAYLYEHAWNYFEYERNRIRYDIALSVIQNKRNLKPNPYLADTARHLFASALGAAPGYAPACNNNSLPFEFLQRVFVNSYGLKKYYPTLMQPIHYNFEKDKFPIYYSLQYPSTHVFSPKSRKISSTLHEMRELEYIMRIFTEELSSNNSICSDSVLGNVANEIEFKYFHNEIDQHGVINPSSEIVDYDNRFLSVSEGNEIPTAKFASDAQFVRGCISIKSIC